MPFEFQQEQKETKELIALPSTITELEEATSSAFLFGDKHLGLWTADGTELSTIAYEEWVDVTSDLDEMFFELRDGILGKQLLNFAKLDDAELVNPHIRSEIESLLVQTAPLAKKMNPLIDRLCAVNPTMTRADIIATLREGEILATETVDYVSKQPVRRSLLGILHDLGERIGRVAVEEKQESPETSTLWDFENRTIYDLTPVVILSDPFSNDAESLNYWSERGGESILKRSEQKTQSIIYELENLRQTMVGNGDKKKVMDALTVIESWLESNMILYRDGKEVDFELYHLGMEEPQEVDAIFGSLDIIKHDNPEFFVSLMGINPEGGKSPYFGSFIHKALFNTQKTLDGIVTEAPNLVLKSSMKQLLRIDGHVQRWNFSETISEESLRALAQKRQEQEDEAKTPEEKAQIRLFWQAILTKPTIEVAVKRQLEAMKEVNFKELKTELLAKLNDQEHPMLALKAISTLPLIAFRDGAIKNRLTTIFGNELMKHPDILRKHCAEEHPEMVRLIFNQIPIVNKNDGTLTSFFQTVVREARGKEGRLGELMRRSGWLFSHQKGRDFLVNVLVDRVVIPEFFERSLQEEERFYIQGYLLTGGNKVDLDLFDKGEVSQGQRGYNGGLKNPSKQPLPIDAELWCAVWNVTRLHEEDRGPQKRSETESDVEVCLIEARLKKGEGAKILMKHFREFRLSKSDAAKVVRVMFEHLPNRTSYEKFEFLLKHAEKFEEWDIHAFLAALPRESELLEKIFLSCKEKYPAVFEQYFLNIVSWSNWVMNGEHVTIENVIHLLLGILKTDDGKEHEPEWSEENIINFAKTPGFDKVFCKFAKEIFEAYPNLPVKLYGEWGARMVGELKIVETRPTFLKQMLEICPKDASDGVMEKWKKLRGWGEIQWLDEEKMMGMANEPAVQEMIVRLIASFRREFPEVTNESYREMRELFGERMLGFTEVEKKFVAVSGAQIVDIEQKEREEAMEVLEKKLQEPDIQKFLEYLRNDPKEKERWILIYRAKNREERNYESGWFFVQSEADARTRWKNLDSEKFSLEEQQAKMRDVACLVGLDPKKIHLRSINETLYDMTVAKELLPENSQEGIWEEPDELFLIVEMLNGHPTVINYFYDAKYATKAGKCIAR